jgi:hypothetical protein
LTSEANTLVLTVDPPVTGIIPHKDEVYETLVLVEPRAGEMRVANGHVRTGVNLQTVYVRNAHLISLVSKRGGQFWPVTAVEMLTDSQFTEAADFLLGFSERAHLRALQVEMENAAREQAGSENGS